MDTRQAGFSLSVASGDALDVREFVVEERISSLFSVTVTVAAAGPDIDLEAIIGRPARFDARTRVAGVERARAWTGVCKEVHELTAEEHGLSTYAVEIAPTLWLADLRRNHRMFQGRSDVDVALALLAEWGIDPVRELSATYRKRKYRVQYGESDYAFLRRVLEDAGVSFHFTDATGESRLVLSDAPHARDLREPAIRFRDKPGDADLEHVTALRLGRKLRPGRYTVRDLDYRRPPTYRLAATAATSGVEEKLERYHYTPGAFLFESDRGDATPAADDRGRYRTDESEGAAIAQRRLDAERADALSYGFDSNVVDLAPGVVIGVSEHPRRDLQGRRLLVVATRMRGVAGESWKIEAEARHADAPYRPPLVTPRPKVDGVESATVVGPPGEEIHTDELGRVRVHFHWDRESRMNAESSCWIPVSQPWGGAGYGGINLPRVGHEVLVDFLGGDPDRPVIVGRVYTSLQRVPYDLPRNKTQSGWRSNSTDGTGGFNEILFEDASGHEVVQVRAQRDLVEDVLHDRTSTVTRDRSATIGGDDRLVVQGNTQARVEGRSDGEIALDRSLGVGGDSRESVARSRSLQVGGDDAVRVGGSSTHEVAGTSSVVVGGHHVVRVGADEAEGDLSVNVFGRHTVGVTRAITLNAGEGLTLRCGQSELRLGSDGISITAPKIQVSALDRVTVNGDGPCLTLGEEAELVGGKVRILSSNAFLELDDGAALGGQKVKLEGPRPSQPKDGEAEKPGTKQVKVRFTDESFMPYAAKRYEVGVEGELIRGETDIDGNIVAAVPKEARVMTVTMWMDKYPEGRRRSWSVALGTLADASTVRGVKERLKNLGYYAGKVDDEEDPKLAEAVRAFQTDREIETTGAVDAATAAEIKQVHGS